MNYKKAFFLLLFFLFVMGAYFFYLNYGAKQNTGLKQDNTIVELPESFVDFYQKFHKDSIFQLEHIIFPLEGLPAMIDSSTDVINFKWNRDNWLVHKTFNSHNGTYVREFDNLNGIINERIYDTGHNFEMRKRYSRMGENWYLIYYAAMNSTIIYQ